MMREADAEISRDNAEGLFVTVLAGILDARTGELEYCSAGHEPPLLLPRGGRALLRLAEGGGPPLCAVDGFPYVPATRRLEPGDTLCLITDGITEAAEPDGRALRAGAARGAAGALGGAASAAEVGEAIRRDVAAFTGGTEPSDDMAVLIARASSRWERAGDGPERQRTLISTRRLRGSATSSGGGHERLALPAPRHADALGRDADLHQLVAHPLGAPERERVVVGHRADPVGVADDHDLRRGPPGDLVDDAAEELPGVRGQLVPALEEVEDEGGRPRRLRGQRARRRPGGPPAP